MEMQPVTPSPLLFLRSVHPSWPSIQWRKTRESVQSWCFLCLDFARPDPKERKFYFQKQKQARSDTNSLVATCLPSSHSDIFSVYSKLWSMQHSNFRLILKRACRNNDRNSLARIVVYLFISATHTVANFWKSSHTHTLWTLPMCIFRIKRASSAQ